MPFLKKLIILLPIGEQFPESIEEDEFIQKVHPLEYAETVAGNINREYNSSVYRVNSQGEDPVSPCMLFYLYTSPHDD